MALNAKIYTKYIPRAFLQLLVLRNLVQPWLENCIPLERLAIRKVTGPLFPLDWGVWLARLGGSVGYGKFWKLGLLRVILGLSKACWGYCCAETRQFFLGMRSRECSRNDLLHSVGVAWLLPSLIRFVVVRPWPGWPIWEVCLCTHTAHNLAACLTTLPRWKTARKLGLCTIAFRSSYPRIPLLRHNYPLLRQPSSFHIRRYQPYHQCHHTGLCAGKAHLLTHDPHAAIFQTSNFSKLTLSVAWT